MLSRLAPFSLFLCLACALLLALVQALTTARLPSPYAAVFSAPNGEVQIFGIRPEATRLELVPDLLTAYNVERPQERSAMDFLGSEHLDLRATLGNTVWRGEVVSRYGMVYQLRLEPESGDPVLLGDLWLAMGKPSLFDYSLGQTRADGFRLNASFFPDASLRVIAEGVCPFHLHALWRSHVEAVSLFAPVLPIGSAPAYQTLAAIPRGLRRLRAFDTSGQWQSGTVC